MWIERFDKKYNFINYLTGLNRQVLVVTGARQVGKTSFILNALQDLQDHPQIRLNFFYPHSLSIGDVPYFGQDFFGSSPAGDTFLKNLERELGPFKNLSKPALIFMDEVDRYPLCMEGIQALAEFSDRLKFVMTGSNLENISLKNAATGRKKYFDLYPITFLEFLRAGGKTTLLHYIRDQDLSGKNHAEFYHKSLSELFNVYLRLGGMPKLLDAYLDPQSSTPPIPEIMRDLAVTIEENVKTVLGEKTTLYAYEDVLRKLTRLSMNTLKWTRLQVQHASRYEAKKLVGKTVGARVAHKIRLWETERDLSKYLLFDCGLANYLLNGSDLLKTDLGEQGRAILLETFVGNDLIARLTSRDDLFYWKSGNQAELEFFLRSPRWMGMDVKTGRGDNKSLNSFALLEREASCLVKIHEGPLQWKPDYIAALPHESKKRTIPFLAIPYYLTGRLLEWLAEIPA